MRKLTFHALAAVTLLTSASAGYAQVTQVGANTIQGTLVHSGGAQTDFQVEANLGAQGPLIVNFTGNTNQTNATSDLLTMQGGNGQADVTGATVGSTTFDLLSGNIFLSASSGLGIDFIEFALNSDTSGTVDFFITSLTGGVSTTTPFLDAIIGTGNTFFGFNTGGSTIITNVAFVSDPLLINTVGEVRIGTASLPGAVPEPGTWAMMLLGFGGMGVAMRRRRRTGAQLAQVA
jgi:hypothetical protein